MFGVFVGVFGCLFDCLFKRSIIRNEHLYKQTYGTLETDSNKMLEPGFKNAIKYADTKAYINMLALSLEIKDIHVEANLKKGVIEEKDYCHSQQMKLNIFTVSLSVW